MAFINFQPSDYFNTKLYTGNDTDNRAITGIGFAPDLCWFKLRNISQQHELFDQVRGANKPISSNATDAETTATNKLKSFDSDGFTLGTSTSVNKNYNYVSWNWKANGAGSSNTDGSITSTVSASTASGFSIIKYTGTGANASIGTGLGAIPHMAIFKRTDTSGFNWFVYHRSLGAGKFITLDTNLAQESSTSIWQNTTPTSSVITLGGDGGVNASGGTYICYAFTEKKGFSAMGSYVGNGSTDGSFIYTNGMKPSMVIIKLYTTGAENWRIFDNKRIGYNPNNYKLYPSGSFAEGTSDLIDIYSNGFKPRSNSVEFNGSGNGYIYIAFAESPIVSSNGVPATAR